MTNRWRQMLLGEHGAEVILISGREETSYNGNTKCTPDLESNPVRSRPNSRVTLRD